MDSCDLSCVLEPVSRSSPDFWQGTFDSIDSWNEVGIIITSCQLRPRFINEDAKKILALILKDTLDEEPGNLDFLPFLQQITHPQVDLCLDSGREHLFSVRINGKAWSHFLRVKANRIDPLNPDSGFVFFLTLEENRKDRYGEQLFLQQILDNCPSLIYARDMEGRYILVNSYIEQRVGLPREEILGKKPQDFFPKEVAQKILKEDKRVLNSNIGIVDEEIMKFDGVERVYIVTKFPLRNESGQKYAVGGIATDITERKRLEEELRVLATKDSLTSIDNRRHFMELFEKELIRSKRNGQPVSVIIFDIDKFKAINDEYGHSVGDEVLKHVTMTCHRLIRDIDIFGRIGGEEFAIGLVETSLSGADLVADRILSAIATTPYVHSPHTISITVSAGVTQYLQTDDLNSLLKRADDLLYEAKAKGRNTFVSK